MHNKPFTFYEFFAGGGMARSGLGPDWQCLFANDFDQKKGASYALNWGGEHLKIGDVRDVETSELPGQADLIWGSFPCQDLSLAGGGAGLKGERSGTFWPFWSLIEKLDGEGRPPNMIVLENVCGALSSHGGKDFSEICCAMHRTGYQYGAVVIDAALFVPQSRPRLFVIAVRTGYQIPNIVQSDLPSAPWHTTALKRAQDKLSADLKENWVWWDLPVPVQRETTLTDIIEESPSGVNWHSKQETQKLLDLMSEVNLAKVKAAQCSGELKVGTIYKRTRREPSGVKQQRAEVRFDDIAGCLRTPSGGSSRQLILVVKGDDIRSRLISSRETARLMGLPESYKLPDRYNEAYHLTGDGVAVPVVDFLAKEVFQKVLLKNKKLEKDVA